MGIQDLLPGVDAVRRIQIRPGDVLVIECERNLSEKERENLTALVTGVWPGHKVTVWPPGIRLASVCSHRDLARVVEDGAGVHVARD